MGDALGSPRTRSFHTTMCVSASGGPVGCALYFPVRFQVTAKSCPRTGLQHMNQGSTHVEVQHMGTNLEQASHIWGSYTIFSGV